MFVFNTSLCHSTLRSSLSASWTVSDNSAIQHLKHAMVTSKKLHIWKEDMFFTKIQNQGPLDTQKITKFNNKYR